MKSIQLLCNFDCDHKTQLNFSAFLYASLQGERGVTEKKVDVDLKILESHEKVKRTTGPFHSTSNPHLQSVILLNKQ